MTEAEIDERFAFGLVAELLIEQLDLRRDARDQVLVELYRERELVVRWLEQRGRIAR